MTQDEKLECLAEECVVYPPANFFNLIVSPKYNLDPTNDNGRWVKPLAALSSDLFEKHLDCTRIKSHLAGIPGQGIQICDSVPDDVKEAALEAIQGANKRRKTMRSSSNNEVYNPISRQQNHEVEDEERMQMEVQDIEQQVGEAGTSFLLEMEDNVENHVGQSLQFVETKGEKLLTTKLKGIPDNMKRCKLVLTTRSLNVCRKMDCQKNIKVKPLLVDASWELFLQELGHQIMPSLEKIAKSIVLECKGLPLGIKVMARNMKQVDDIHEWNARVIVKNDEELSEMPEWGNWSKDLVRISLSSKDIPLRALKKLDLYGSGVEKVPKGIKLLSNLRYLDLCGTNIEELQPGILPKLSQLRFLRLGFSFTVEGKEVASLRKLEELECRFHGVGELNTFMTCKPSTSQMRCRLLYQRRGNALSLPREVKSLIFDDATLKAAAYASDMQLNRSTLKLKIVRV
ncbi:hypothetical protein GH714_010811 [Hevea brasiliensis]|uniref:NB-ARC domain-containing protein n=1 Tax=Hevea brasiliensis TaxID=3981 RepID=A0A6A6MXY6_HEVBR|nr:hypothetical protein GH714_010811 [Hevea brasiliensis]